jgi:REP element-mobilizing transposase RayT
MFSKKKSLSGTQKRYLLHEFVVMPDHFHLILTPKPEDCPYSSAHPSFKSSSDPTPQRLKPVSPAALPQA